MKLFHQLSVSDQEKVMEYCVSTVLQDFFEDDVEIASSSDEDESLTKHVANTIAEAREIEDEQSRYEYLMSDPEVSQVVFDLASEMSKTAYYPSPEDFVIFPEELDEHFCENCQDEEHDHSTHESNDELNLTEEEKRIAKNRRNMLN